MNGPKLGELITNNEQRDAIHIAVLPVTAGECLGPSAWVRFKVPGNNEVVVSCKPQHAVGIIDPFLTNGLDTGNQCWMFMMPNTITSLRHEWSHPQVDGENTQGIAEFWLREFANKYGLDYDHMLDMVQRYGGRISTGDRDIDMDQDDYDKLSIYLSVVLGKEISNAGFSCAC